MAGTSQVSNLSSISDLSGLTHEVFKGSVLPTVRWESATATMFDNAGEGDYTYVGKKLVGATDLQRPTGAMGTDGKLPDAADFDAVQWETTPVRRYRRFAVDNFSEARATGEGAFGDFMDRVFDQLWGAFRLMEIRHAIGGAAGTLCKVSSRTSSTVWVAKDGYGHTGMNGVIMLDEGMVISYIDVSASNAVGGAGKISSINYSNSTVTMAASWEGTNNAAANDLVVSATTTSTSATYFTTERNAAKNGLLSIVDPNADLTTVLNISQSTYPRWKPYRKTSGTFDSIEVTEFMQQLEAKSTMPVTNSTHTIVLHPALYATLGALAAHASARDGVRQDVQRRVPGGPGRRVRSRDRPLPAAQRDVRALSRGPLHRLAGRAGVLRRRRQHVLADGRLRRQGRLRAGLLQLVQPEA